MDIIEQFITTHRRLILNIITAIIMVIIGYNIIILISRIGKIPVTVMYAPFDSDVIINNKNYKNNQVHYLEPGDYHVEVNREHFQTLVSDYTITNESKDMNFIGGLRPNDEEGESIAKSQNREFLKVESIGSIDAEKQANKLFDEAPIAQYLPINFNTYSVSYNYDQDGKFYIELILKQGIEYSTQAVASLYNIDNVDPASYRIIIRNYKDPFGEFKQNNESDIIKYIKYGYGNIFDNYQILDDRIINYGDYYGILITPNNIDLGNDSASYPIYRMIIKQNNNNTWSIISSPYPVVSQYNASGVPIDFLNRLNRTFVSEDI